MNETGVSRACATAAMLVVLMVTGCAPEQRPATLARPATFSDLSLAAITDATLADMRKQRFISIKGVFHDKDLAYSIRGKLGPNKSCHYEIVGVDGKLEILAVSGDNYWKYSEKMLRSLVGQSRTEDAFVAKAADRWIEGEAPPDEFSEFCHHSSLLKYVGEQLEDGRPDVKSARLGGRGDAAQVFVPAGSVTIANRRPHLVAEMIDGGDLMDFRYDDTTPIKRPRPRDIVVIPGFTPEGTPV